MTDVYVLSFKFKKNQEIILYLYQIIFYIIKLT